MSEIRTRIAPSPTGYMHIGNLRTMLWDYFIARQAGGQFIIRVEDTDQERFIPGSIEALLKTLEKIGCNWDEGPILNADGTLGEKGDYGPYTQTHRLDIYKKYLDQLLVQGDAYHCFCTPERLTTMREAQVLAHQTPKYDRTCLHLSKDEIETRLKALKEGDSHVVRLHVPEGESEFTDPIRGTVRFQHADVDDQVLMKSSGIPTYHLAVVVDDYLMKISHVLRGEEWLSSTPKQIILHRMLGFPMPIYAHVPLLLNADKTKLSKRKGDVSVEGYLQKGYLPIALKNFLSTLGFNPSGDREIYTEQELIQSFDLSKVNRSGAVVNTEKLDWMNGQYLKQMTNEEYLACVSSFMNRELSTHENKRALLEKQRAHTLVQIQSVIESEIVFSSEYDSSLLIWKKSNAQDAKQQLGDIQDLVLTLAEQEPEHNEKIIKQYIEERTLQNGNVLWPLRVALSGLEKSLSPFELLWILSEKEIKERIDLAIQKLDSLV